MQEVSGSIPLGSTTSSKKVRESGPFLLVAVRGLLDVNGRFELGGCHY
jgi:hypothetical protein